MTKTEIDFTEDVDYDAMDRIIEVLDVLGDATPSVIARKAKVSSTKVYEYLTYLVQHRYVHTSGNGAWRHYHRGRGW